MKTTSNEMVKQLFASAFRKRLLPDVDDRHRAKIGREAM